MSSSYVSVDLSTLAAPSIVETLDFETIVAAMLADLQSRDTTFTALLESDPAYKVLEVCAYRELLMRQRVNDACNALLLAYATGTNLDQLGANSDLERLTVTGLSGISCVAGHNGNEGDLPWPDAKSLRFLIRYSDRKSVV